MTHSQPDVLIAGGGLCGLAIAEALAREGGDFLLLEARDRLGGRVLSKTVAGGRFDLGPTWVWPHNRRVLALANRMELDLHRQHAEGRLVFQDRAGAVRRDFDFATMGDALRVSGGLGHLTDALARKLDEARVRTGTRVEAVSLTPGGVAIEIDGPGGPSQLSAPRLVLAVPPRLLAARFAFAPPLPAAVGAAFEATPTWMAGQAKLVAVYRQPFWRTAGLSGDAISHRGPLVEIHDATDANTGVPALFGFAAPGVASRPGFPAAARAQLAALFGPDAGRPEDVLVHDWSDDGYTATAADAAPLPVHPAYGFRPHLRQAIADWSEGRVVFAGTETAAEEGGFLEGALASAEAALAALARAGHRPGTIIHPAP